MKGEAKMELLSLTTSLMPEGKPNFLSMIRYPMVKNLVADLGRKMMLKVLFLLVKDFCSSLNVVRNMNEDQMIEAANMLIDECENFRMEDYVMMFSLAKKGKLVKIMDRVDIQLITAMLDEYWERRQVAGNKEANADIEQEKIAISYSPTSRNADDTTEMKKLFHEANLDYYKDKMSKEPKVEESQKPEEQ